MSIKHIITYKDYFIESEDTKFNVYFKTTAFNKKLNKQIPKNISLGYGIPFDKCIKSIISKEISRKHNVIELKDYLGIYAQEAISIINTEEIFERLLTQSIKKNSLTKRTTITHER